MKKLSIAALVSFLFVVACQRVPLSGRNQLMLVNSKELLPMSFIRNLGDQSDLRPGWRTTGLAHHRAGAPPGWRTSDE